VFAAHVASMAEHLGRHQLADLYLDTLPYNAHSTACDALWAGVPVLTCSGRTFASRVAASALTAVGLPELITQDLQSMRAGVATGARAGEIAGAAAPAGTAARALTSVRYSRLLPHLETSFTKSTRRHRR